MGGQEQERQGRDPAVKARLLKVTEEFMDFIKQMGPGTRMAAMAVVRDDADEDVEVAVTIERDPVDKAFYFRFES